MAQDKVAREARDIGINLSQAAMHGLAAETATMRWCRWLGENRGEWLVVGATGIEPVTPTMSR